MKIKNLFKPNTFFNLLLLCFCKFMKDIEPDKICKILINWYYICFIFSMVKPNMRKSFSLIFYFLLYFSNTFQVPNAENMFNSFFSFVMKNMK